MIIRRSTIGARFAAWLGRRYGAHGRAKPVWAWLAEAMLFGWRPRQFQRRIFYAPDGPPDVGRTERQ